MKVDTEKRIQEITDANDAKISEIERELNEAKKRADLSKAELKKKEEEKKEEAKEAAKLAKSKEDQIKKQKEAEADKAK